MNSMGADRSLAAAEASLAAKRILVTGHTGFTGSWACLWLKSLGAEVLGYSLPPPTTPSLFEDAHVADAMQAHVIGDVGDFERLDRAVGELRPELILHLAAQPLVRRSYREPLETYRANVMGTANLLEAARRHGVAGVVCITTDKVYENREWSYGYRENDRLGGADPYSASKAAAELVAASYRSSMSSWSQQMLIAVARGGNIIGGGDWAEDRLIPDIARAVQAGQPITLRNPASVRPWQHVLCLVHGYIALLAGVVREEQGISEAWNLGPTSTRLLTVEEVTERLRRSWPSLTVELEAQDLHETKLLSLDSTKAQRLLGWSPGWTTEEGIDQTARWYASYLKDAGDCRALTLGQIEDYRAASGA